MFSFLGLGKTKPEVAQPVNPKDFETEIGATGVKNYAGSIWDEEQNAKLSNGEFYDIIHQYYRTDSTLASGFRWLTAPVRLANWGFNYPRGVEGNKEVLNFCNRIWLNSDRSWQDTIQSIVPYLLFGNMPLEKVFKIDESTGTTWLSKLSPRKPTRDNKYLFDQDGNLSAYVQVHATKDGSGFTEYVIPADKLVFFRNDDFFSNNYEGISIARQAYRSLKMKDELMLSWRAMLKRFGAPIPIFTEPESESLKTAEVRERNSTAIKEVAWQFRAGNNAYAKIPAGWGLAFAQADTNSSGFDSAVRYHDSQILSSMSAQVLGMGSSLTSTQGLGQTFENVGGYGPAVIAKYIGDTLDKQLFKTLIDMNFGPQEHYPCFSATNLKHDPSQILPYITSAMQGGGITKTLETEAWMRELAQAPGISASEFAAAQQAQAPQSAASPRQERRDSLRSILNPSRSQAEQAKQPNTQTEE